MIRLSDVTRSGALPWTGLFAGAAAWALHHQIGSDVTFSDCGLGGPWLIGGLGLVFGLVAVAGGLVSWRTRHAGPDREGREESRRFAAFVGVAGAGFFLLAIVFQTLAGFIVPACHP